MALDLTYKQRAFVSEYIRHKGNGTKAAIAAGYANGNSLVAAVRASQLIRKPKIKRQIDKLTRKYDITPERVLARLDNLSIKAQEEGNYAASVKAEELIGKSLGMWVDRSVNVNVDLNGSHIDAIRALAARRSKFGGSSAGDNARVIEGDATTAPGDADKPIFHNADYASDADKPVIDQRVSRKRALKQSCKPTSDVDGDNI